MEIASIRPGFDFRIKASHAPKHLILPSTINNFITAAAPQFQLSDIEMVKFEETSPYTSLKDLLHTSPPPSFIIMSPNNSSASPCTKDSWREIPMKDPLLQHAAWAYLQPAMSRSTDSGLDRNGNALLDKLKEWCSGVFGCLNDVVLAMTNNFCFRKGISPRRRQKWLTDR